MSFAFAILLVSLEADKARSTEMRALGKAVQLDAEVDTTRKGKSKGKGKEVALDGADKSAGEAKAVVSVVQAGFVLSQVQL